MRNKVVSSLLIITLLTQSAAFATHSDGVDPELVIAPYDHENQAVGNKIFEQRDLLIKEKLKGTSEEEIAQKLLSRYKWRRWWDRYGGVCIEGGLLVLGTAFVCYRDAISNFLTRMLLPEGTRKLWDYLPSLERARTKYAMRTANSKVESAVQAIQNANIQGMTGYKINLDPADVFPEHTPAFHQQVLIPALGACFDKKNDEGASGVINILGGLMNMGQSFMSQMQTTAVSGTDTLPVQTLEDFWKLISGQLGHASDPQGLVDLAKEQLSGDRVLAMEVSQKSISWIRKQLPNAGMLQQGVFMAMSTSIAVYTFWKLLPGFYKSVKKALSKVDPLEKQKERYISLKRFMPTELQSRIEELFKIADSDPTAVTKVANFLSNAFALPFHDVKLAFSREKAKEIFAGCPKEAMEEMLDYLESYVNNEKNPVRGVILKGPPGVGKTFLAHKMADALGVKAYKISLAEVSMKDLFGEYDFAQSDAFHGQLATALTALKGKSGVIVFDDGDRFLRDNPAALSRFLLLLDRENQKIYNEYYKCNLPIGKIVLVFTSNYEIEDPAIKDRCFEVDVNGYTAEEKRLLVWNTLLPQAVEGLGLEPSNKDELLNTLQQKEHQDKINAAIALDQNPGLRTIQKALEMYVSYLSKLKTFGKAKEPELVKFIEKSNERVKGNEVYQK